MISILMNAGFALGHEKTRTGEMTYEKIWMNNDLYGLLKWQWKHRHPTSPYVFCHMNPKSKYYGNLMVKDERHSGVFVK
jgi:hypothetical protein